MTRLTVTALTQQIERLLQRSYPRIEVEGELVQLQVPASGHAYLTLRDGDASLSCIVWRNEWRQHTQAPRVGQRVVCTGRLGAYAPQGRYQLYATRAALAGQGELQARLEKVRARLREDGLLDPRRRRPLPRYPRVIGLATSLVGAALQDFLRVSRHRWPAARILVSGCTVQGDQAASSVVRALELLYEDGRADVIILTRGGGSQLDLLPFYDEQLARWVATSPVPIVSAVGHEVDTPLTDEVADASASTPSAAAMLVLPDGPALRQRVDEAVLAMERAALRGIGARRVRLRELAARLRHPARTLVEHQRRRVDLERRLHDALMRQLRAMADRLDGVERRLAALSPAAVLGRGYAIVHGPGGVVRDPADVAPGDPLSVRLARGVLSARAE